MTEPPSNPDELLDVAALAALAGVVPRTIRAELGRSRRHRRAGESKPGDLPEPDQVLGGRPAWRRATGEAWLAGRPSASWRRR